MADELHDRAFARKIASQHGEPAALLQRPVDGDDDLLPRRLLRGSGDLCERAAVDVHCGPVDEPGPDELPRDETDATGAMEVGGDEASTRLEIGDDRRARRDLVEVFELERQVELARDREEVENGVRRAAGGGDRSDRILDRRPRQDRGRPHVPAHELERKLAGLFSSFALRRVERGDPVQACRADAEKLERERHRVGCELSAARTGAWARNALELVHVLRAHRPRGMCTNRFEHVLDRHVPSAEAARRDRAVVEHEAREVETGEGHHGRGDRLVAADDADEPVEEVSARDKLDRVRDHLARDE